MATALLKCQYYSHLQTCGYVIRTDVRKSGNSSYQNQQTWYNRYKGRGDNKYLFTPEIHNEKLKESDLLLYKVKEIIDYFNNSTFTIENPYHNKFNSIIMICII